MPTILAIDWKIAGDLKIARAGTNKRAMQVMPACSQNRMVAIGERFIARAEPR